MPANFSDLGLVPPLIDALAALGYEEPTPIQQEAIPPLLQGSDLLGLAATGTGKTAAFALPLLQRIATFDEEGDGRPSMLVLVPTRELAMQVAEAIHRYGRPLGRRVVPIYGGQAFDQQIRALRRGVDVVVGTPGRALDHIRRGTLDLDGLGAVVLDEADEMLDMGFADDLESILEATPAARQTALFSATMPPRIAGLAERHMRSPVRVEVESAAAEAGALPRVRQVAYVVQRAHKLLALGRVLDIEVPTLAIVFCRTRTEVDTLAETLASRGYSAEALHGGLSQEQRDRVMKRARGGNVDLLIATDVAARGLDIPQVSHVVNFDVPSDPAAYVHRIGRTGRAGREGVAITLAEPREHRWLRQFERAAGAPIEVATVPTVLEVRARRLEVTQAAVRDAILDGDLDQYRVVVEALTEEFDPMDVALGAVKLAHQQAVGEEDTTEIPATPAPRGPRPGKRERETRQRGQRPPRRGRAGEESFVRIYIGSGRRDGVRPADLVGAIANEAGIEGRAIGAIDIADNFSLVELPAELADDVIDALNQTAIRGKRLSARHERDRADRGGHAPASRSPRRAPHKAKAKTDRRR
ncbi:MAG TPA: DEAD/DEAH box helicase [Gemmatimonadales bacterium]|nr:DEAD/DEAH box helicase [Gemmatimonadales bacterium]